MSIDNQSKSKSELDIAILDTGYDGKIADFGAENICFKDFCGITMEPEDLDGHGSHLTGIVLSQQPESNMLSGRVMTHAYLVALDPMIAGVRWAIEQGVDVILVAAGFGYDKIELREVVLEALNANILVISAIGNNGETGETAGHFPARYPGVLSVGSVNVEGKISDFTDQYPGLTILAPGENINSFYLNGEMAEGSGTSQAAANVTAAVANILSACHAHQVTYSTNSIINLLQRTGRPTSPPSAFKIIDQAAALAAVAKL